MADFKLILNPVVVLLFYKDYKLKFYLTK
jgi:hypothetical protein